MDTPITLGTIGQIAIPVQNLDRAIAFYRDQLGMLHLFRAGELAFFDAAGVRLLLSVPESAELRQHSSIIYFKVPDIQRGYTELQARGVAFEDQPHLIAKMGDHDLWMVFFRDSENNLLGLMAEHTPA